MQSPFGVRLLEKTVQLLRNMDPAVFCIAASLPFAQCTTMSQCDLLGLCKIMYCILNIYIVQCNILTVYIYIIYL